MTNNEDSICRFKLDTFVISRPHGVLKSFLYKLIETHTICTLFMTGYFENLDDNIIQVLMSGFMHIICIKPLMSKYQIVVT